MTWASQNVSGFAFSARSKLRSGNTRSSSAGASSGLFSQLCFSAGTRSCPSSARSVWGDELPASAAHSLESGSRLRGALSPYGVALERRGGRYRRAQPRTIGDYVGHGSTYMTDRYRHQLEGHEQEAARMLEDYLARADTAAPLEQIAHDE
jgi:hypothetical protein